MAQLPWSLTVSMKPLLGTKQRMVARENEKKEVKKGEEQAKCAFIRRPTKLSKHTGFDILVNIWQEMTFHHRARGSRSWNFCAFHRLDKDGVRPQCARKEES